MTDARTRRTRDRLALAITALGGTVRLEQMTVDDVVAASGLSKSTVYRHAKSPARFMADRFTAVLEHDLVEAISTDYGPGTASWRHSMRHRQALTALWNETTARFAMYRLSVREPDSIILDSFVTIQEQLAVNYLEENLEKIQLPEVLAGANRKWTIEVLTHQYCHGLIVLFKAMLADDEPLPLESFISLARDLMPCWQCQLLRQA
ncbi:MAG: hypothetical protein ACOX61_12310 [Brooklawnia sp.]|jgi:AcrR family transcriptional regulator